MPVAACKVLATAIAVQTDTSHRYPRTANTLRTTVGMERLLTIPLRAGNPPRASHINRSNRPAARSSAAAPVYEADGDRHRRGLLAQVAVGAAGFVASEVH